jgi:gamma-glutamyltranspeptidase/glutathione hydrolase
MSWRELIEPAIILAREGFVVSGHLAGILKKLAPFRDRYPGLDIFFNDRGEPLGANERLVQPELALTLERIADRGEKDFYAGETAALLVEEMARGNGLVTHDDLRMYRARMREPVTGTYRGYEIVSAPLPSSGGTILVEMLNILEGFPLGSYGPGSVEAIHTIVEAERRAYADRAHHLGDGDFVNPPISLLISKEYADAARSGISDTATASEDLKSSGTTGQESEETTHFSIVDSDGNAAAVTTTLNGSFGSKVVVGGAGFLLNNEMDDFSIKPGEPNMYGLTGGDANAIEPGKRMLSSMAPTIVAKAGELTLVAGTPGGATIITTVLQVIVNIIDFGMEVEYAVAYPRFHHQWSPDYIICEPGAVSATVRGDLKARGHSFKERKTPIGDAQVIMMRNGRACGISDPRGGGCAAGVVTAGSTR